MSTLACLLAARASECPDAPALLAPGRPPLDYSALWAQVGRFADTIERHEAARRRSVAGTSDGGGDGGGDDWRVAVGLPNGPEMAAACLAVACTTACVPVNPLDPAPELVRRLGSSRVACVVLSVRERGALREAADKLGLPLIEVDWHDTDPAGSLRLPEGPGTICVADARDASDLRDRPRRPRPAGQATDIALVFQTSGTTAAPKVVRLSHANLLAVAQQVARAYALSPTDRCLNVMPLYHCHALVFALISMLVAGGSMACAHGYDGERFAGWLRTLGATWYTAVPAIHQAIVASAAQRAEALRELRLRFIASGSAPMPPVTIGALESLFGAPVIESYGLTETSTIFASNPLGGLRKPGSVGLPLGGEIVLLDPAGARVPQGDEGEIAVRSAGLMQAYENDDAANREAFRDGWFRTGDLGRQDADGYLYVTGRIKEVVNRGGVKVSPREIDDALASHPAVAQAAAFGVPHPTLGEDLVAAVVLEPGASLDATGLRAWLGQSLSAAKVPARIEFVDALPRTGTGKVQRFALTARFARPGGAGARAGAADALAGPHGDDAPLQRLRDAWCVVLHTDSVGDDEDFFAAGGDSLRAVALLAAIERALGVQWSLADLMAAPTVRAQRARLSGGIEMPRASRALLPIRIDGALPPLFLAPGFGCPVRALRAFASAFPASQPIYALDVNAFGEADGLAAGAGPSLVDMARRLLDAVRTVQPAGPYQLAGFSLGGRLVFEMARQLRARGERVALLALLDAAAPGYPRPVGQPRRALRHLRVALGRGPAGALRYLLERGKAAAAHAGPTLDIVPAGHGAADSAVARALNLGARAAHYGWSGYEAGPYDGSVLMIRAARRPLNPGLDDDDPEMGWRRFAPDTTAIGEIDCLHVDMLDHPRAIAALLQPRLIAEAPATRARASAYHRIP
jgi:acyl-CoA synthetase (AMP-forming)/AMP-acid ligase II/thioesterase domain-containing protein/aryl carrier-like protein